MSKASKCLLVVEDDPGLRSQLRWCFDDFTVQLAGDREEAVAKLRRHKPSVVTLDLGLPPDPGGVSEGLATLEELVAIAPDTKVIIVTGNDERDNAVKAVGLGAYDFYLKPVDPHTLALVVERAHRLYELEFENRRLQQATAGTLLPGIVAASPAMRAVCQEAEKIAPSNATVLIFGESGTGKELFARALHRLSDRADGPMIAINCAAIPENLLESELFGHEKGAFTGAASQVLGKIEYANGGTLFLDEIGDLPQSLQAKLLRFLQERVIERVGGRTAIPVDVRILGATHQNLETAIGAGRFRQDLFYRISDTTIRLPPLRERDGDALLLARVFLDRFNRDYGKKIRGFTKDAIAAITAFDWPGNVRELESRVKRATIVATGSYLTPAELDLPSPETEATQCLSLQETRERAETQAIRQALEQAAGNLAQAARLLGVTRPTLYNLMKKYAIQPKTQD